jgi:hypothetical protein
VFGVQPGQLDQLCDGESDSTGLLWPLHVRDRLPLDLLSCLPGAVKAVGDRGGAAVPGAAAGAADAFGAEVTADYEHGGVQDAGAVMHQFRPQIQVHMQGGCHMDEHPKTYWSYIVPEACLPLPRHAGAAPGLQQVLVSVAFQESMVCASLVGKCCADRVLECACRLRCLMMQRLTGLMPWWLTGQPSQASSCVPHCWRTYPTWQGYAGKRPGPCYLSHIPPPCCSYMSPSY